MPKIAPLLTAKQLEKITKVGYTAVGGDAHGLNLSIKKTGLRTWTFRYSLNGKRREMGLGGCAEVPLQEARHLASEARDLVTQGIDPIDYRTKQAAAALATNEKKYQVKTFKEVARVYLDNREAEWKNPKHRAQWLSTLENYAFPELGMKDVQDINVHDVKAALEPIWLTKHETATRVRGRIENIIDYAISCEYRDSANPATNRALKAHLPKSSKIKKVKHHSALPYQEVPLLFQEVRNGKSISQMALAFTILTAKRSNEIRGALWGEVDFDTKIWSIPDERMKSGKPHREPLSDESIKFLLELKNESGAVKADQLIFKSSFKGVKLSDMAILEALKHLRPGYTVHGFRSSFRQWAAEQTDHGHHICEMALAHTVLTSVESAYQRSDLLDKRRTLMDDWSIFLSSLPSALIH